MRKLIAAASVALLVSGLVALPALSASAAAPPGVPLPALDLCHDPSDGSDGATKGGWDRRDFLSTSSDGEPVEGFPARPRNVRLGEPCTNTTTGELSIPANLAEVPTPGEYLEGGGAGELPESGTTPDGCAYTGSGYTNRWVEQGGPVAYQKCLGTYEIYGTGGGSLTLYEIDDTHVGVSWTGLVVYGSANHYFALFYMCPSAAPGDGMGYPSAAVLKAKYWATDNGTPTFGNQSFAMTTACGTTDDSGYAMSAPSAQPRLALWMPNASGGVNVRGVWASTAPGGVGGTEGGGSTVGGKPSSKLTFGGGDSYATCADTLGGSNFDVPIDYQITSDGTENSLPAGSGHDQWRLTAQAPTGGIDLDSCAVLVAVHYDVCIWFRTGNSGPAIMVCVTAVWSAEGYTAGDPYVDPTDPEYQICEKNPELPGCYDILNPPDVDGSDISVCDGSPEPEWLSFGWLGPWVVHWATCLFIPANGFDREHYVSLTWSYTAAGQLGSVVGETAEAFQFGETCGVLFSGDFRGTGMAMSTCDWSWASNLKGIITIGLVVLFSLWGLRFLTSTIVGLFSRKTPNPIGGDEE